MKSPSSDIIISIVPISDSIALITLRFVTSLTNTPAPGPVILDTESIIPDAFTVDDALFVTVGLTSRVVTSFTNTPAAKPIIAGTDIIVSNPVISATPSKLNCDINS